MDNKIQQRLQVKACIEEIKDIDELSRLFFRELFHLDVSLEHLFPGSVLVLNRKFANMLNTLKNVKHLEKISDSLASMGERHLQKYGVKVEHLPLAQHALLAALEAYPAVNLAENNLNHAWENVFNDVADLMIAAMQQSDSSDVQLNTYTCSHPHFLADIGGEEVVTRVHERFYDVMFEHPWLEGFFYGKSKSSLIMKQSQFMVAAFGGKNEYQGDTPAFAHMHMFITDAMLDERQHVLRAAILAEGLSPDEAQYWLDVDDSFRSGIAKQDVSECVTKCPGQFPLVVKDRKN